MEKFWEFMGKLFVGSVMIFLSVIWGGFVFMKLWKWFIVPTFDTKPLLLIQAIGTIMVVSLVTHRNIKAEKDQDWEDIVKGFFIACFVSVGALFFGWIASLFM